MRRKDREITDRKMIDAIINEANVLHLGLCKENKPYVVPLSFGYDGEYIYFHSTLDGMKIEHINSNPNVCFEMVTDSDLVTHESLPCNFSVSFRSVVGFGEVSEVTVKEEKMNAMKTVLSHYSDKQWDIPEENVDLVKLWKIGITGVSGKSSK